MIVLMNQIIPKNKQNVQAVLLPLLICGIYINDITPNPTNRMPINMLSTLIVAMVSKLSSVNSVPHFRIFGSTKKWNNPNSVLIIPRTPTMFAINLFLFLNILFFYFSIFFLFLFFGLGKIIKKKNYLTG